VLNRFVPTCLHRPSPNFTGQELLDSEKANIYAIFLTLEELKGLKISGARDAQHRSVPKRLLSHTAKLLIPHDSWTAG
jgi:hypothetical protein